MIQATQVRKGMYIRHDSDLYRVVATEHVTPGKGRGMVQAKIRHIRSGSVMDHRFRSGDRVDRVVLDEMEMEFLYKDGDTYHFMNGETYEQTALSAETLGDTVEPLIEGSVSMTSISTVRGGLIPIGDPSKSWTFSFMLAIR